MLHKSVGAVSALEVRNSTDRLQSRAETALTDLMMRDLLATGITSIYVRTPTGGVRQAQISPFQLLPS